MLPARYRMTRSTEFGATVSQGVRAVQPDLVVHALRADDGTANGGPRIGLVVAKSVGNAVQRHRVARRLRHVARSDHRRAGPRGPRGDSGAAEQPPRHLGAPRTGTACCGAPHPVGKRGGDGEAICCRRRLAARGRDLPHPAVPAHGLSAAPTHVPVHPDLQPVRGRRVERVRPVPRWLAGRGATAQVRAVASGRLGPDTGAPRRLARNARGGSESAEDGDELCGTPANASRERVACLIGSASTSSTTRCRRSCGSGTRRSRSFSGRTTSSPGRCR